MAKAFPDAPIYTSIYSPDDTYPDFRQHDIRTTFLQRFSSLRRNHRLGLPFYALAFSSLQIDADVVLCSSSGWAHGARTQAKKVMYCYTPARWLYCGDDYLKDSPVGWRIALRIVSPVLTRWDSKALSTVDRVLTSSTVVKSRVRDTWGVNATILPPPHGMDASLDQEAVSGVAGSSYLLVVSRLIPYKNVDVVIEACNRMGHSLVVVGDGPDCDRLRSLAGPHVKFIAAASDAQLRWLYANCRALVAASHEDFGLTPLEANAFGRPAVVLRAGGFLDTVIEGLNGCFFDSCSVEDLADGIGRLENHPWSPTDIRRQADRYSQDRFLADIRSAVHALSLPENPPRREIQSWV